MSGSWHLRHILVAAIATTFALASAMAQEQPTLHLREMALLDAPDLAELRQICASDRMPAMKAGVEREGRRDAARGGIAAQLPPVETYCLETLRISARRDLLPDLYINLALQEQGYSSFHFAEQAQLLRNDEAAQTTSRVLRAALAGQAAYESIAQRARPLPCPLALDAGYVWGFRNPERPQPYALTRAEADAIARECYEPQAQSIVVQGRTLSAQQAGVYAGAFFGREAAQGQARQSR